MKTSICHYSYHRSWASEKWTCSDLARVVKGLGVEGIDFHAGLMGPSSEAVGLIKSALAETGLELSGLSLSSNFNQEAPAELDKQVQTVIEWMQVAVAVEAPVSRIFGGHADRQDDKALAGGLVKIMDGLARVTKDAEKLGLVLALENHGGLPGTGEEQVEVIEKIGSPNLRATIDVGNYMGCGQEAHVGTKIAAGYTSYVHFKDFIKKPSDANPWGYEVEACTVGQGDVDHAACLAALKEAGYDGYVALEYEGSADEATAVPESTEFMKRVVAAM